MMITNIRHNRLMKLADDLCINRNQNHPVELGKSLFEPYPEGVEFLKAHYLLDSVHSEYTKPIARLVHDIVDETWLLWFVDEKEEWVVYPYLNQPASLEVLLTEIKYDPQGLIWG
ncbi:hypothetical protein BCU68_04585 [Vibrio sp. 10N.286.49.B3]|nr:hypothetical protein BCU68_04585 [Vibrio sp. 10N.286.49.B3]